MATYDRKKAVQYAQQWANGYNSQYPNPSNFHGTDCTNFVSQCLHQGGWMTTGGSVFTRTDNSTWWFGGLVGTGTSYSWGGAENLRQFCRLSGRTTIKPGVLDTRPGDILFFIDTSGLCYHVAMVTERPPNDVIICQHSSPQNLNRKISEWLQQHVRDIDVSRGNLDDLIRSAQSSGKLHDKIEPHAVRDTIAAPLTPQPSPGPMPR